MTSQSKENLETVIDLSDYKPLFLEQARLFLGALRQSLAQLKGNPDDQEALREAYRAAHTLKGMSSTMRYKELADQAKQMENPFRPELLLSLDQLDAILSGCDEFETGLEQLGEEHCR